MDQKIKKKNILPSSITVEGGQKKKTCLLRDCTPDYEAWWVMQISIANASDMHQRFANFVCSWILRGICASNCWSNNFRKTSNAHFGTITIRCESRPITHTKQTQRNRQCELFAEIREASCTFFFLSSPTPFFCWIVRFQLLFFFFGGKHRQRNILFSKEERRSCQLRCAIPLQSESKSSEKARKECAMGPLTSELLQRVLGSEVRGLQWTKTMTVLH